MYLFGCVVGMNGRLTALFQYLRKRRYQHESRIRGMSLL